MTSREALDLIAAAVPAGAGTWADLGAGTGTFTRALAARLGPPGVVYAVDRDARALASLARGARAGDARIIPVTADLAGEFVLPGATGGLDGVLIANTLHFFAGPGATLARLAAHVRTGGRVVLVEYDRRAASRWVPHPIAPARLPELAAEAGLTPPRVTARRPSAFGGDLYVAVAERRAPATRERT